MTDPTLPPPPPHSPEIAAAVQAARDTDHLRILEVLYYVMGGMTALFSCLFLIHFSLFLFFGLNPQIFTHRTDKYGNPGTPPPPGLFLALAVMFGFFILFGWIFGALQVFVGRCLKKRQHHLFVLIIAGIECIFIPWGTVLGVFTFLILERPSVRRLFGKH